MLKQMFGPAWSVFLGRVFPALAIAALLASVPMPAQLFGHHAKEAKGNPPASPAKPEHPASQPPAFSVPVEPLGFMAPGAFYEGQRASLVSLDFLDEDHILFTFRAPGLIRRDANTASRNEHQVRALLLTLPNGAVAAEGLWTLHDKSRYLWMLRDGHFLVRDRNDLKVGDSSLELTPSLHFSGPLQALEIDPTQALMVAQSEEPANTKAQPGDVPSPPTTSAQITSDRDPAAAKPDIVLRILRRATGQVMLVSRTRVPVHLPINADGFVETLRGRGHEWVLNLNYFRDGNGIIGKIDSMCTPSVEFASNSEVIVTACNPDNTWWMVAMTTDGKRLWNAAKPSTQIWPRLIMAPNGLRFARETLVTTHEVGTMNPISFDEIKEQLVEVYSAATGKVELTAPATPILDGGGNVAISPSARRVAVLDAGAIQVYELPAPAALAAH